MIAFKSVEPPQVTESDWVVCTDDLILVTGGNGFIGTRVVRTLLAYGFKRIQCVLRSSKNISTLQAIIAEFKDANVRILQGNLLSRKSCETAQSGASVIYHLAAGTEKSFPGCFLNSAVTTRNLIEAAIKEQTLKRFVNISSFAVYSNENIRRGGLLDETCEIETNLVERYDPYAYGKAKQDQIVMEYGKSMNLPYVIVRPSVVYGPGKATIPGRVGNDTFGVFLHFGLNNRMPLTYVDNCAEAIVLAGLKKGIDGEVFNIVDDDLPLSREFLGLFKKKVQSFVSIPVPYSLFYLFCYLWEKYSKWSEGQLPPSFNRMMCATYYKGNTYSNQKVKELLGWYPRVRMSEGLGEYFAYVRKSINKSTK
jgi:nucleoside-diphosphate-sugar epimerase